MDSELLLPPPAAGISDASTAGQALLTAANAAAQRSALGLGGAAVLSVGTTAGTVAAGDDPKFFDARTPTAHATSHKSGGSDSIKLDELAAPTDITTLNASTTAHGLALKATAPASGYSNVLGIENGETVYKMVTLGSAAKVAYEKQSIWVPAVGMTARVTSGAVPFSSEASANKQMIVGYDFDPSTAKYVQFMVAMPKCWNEGTVTAKFFWRHPSTSTNFGVVWGIQGVALSDGDAIDASFGTAIATTDTGGNTDYTYASPESSAVTIGGGPAEQDMVVFQVYRDASNGSDTLAVNATLLGVMIYITLNTLTDA